MAKKLSDNQKEEISIGFNAGKTIEQLSNEFECSKLTISRNLKKSLGEDKYKEIISKNKSTLDLSKDNAKNVSDKEEVELNQKKTQISSDEDYQFTTFVELAPVDQKIDSELQKDLASIEISEFDFPKIVYMIVNNKIELETKLLKEYPEWNFLPQNDLDRKTIEIYIDLKIAKRFCNKDQKVIKVPNTNVFKIVAPLLCARGISRIISDTRLIAL